MNMHAAALPPPYHPIKDDVREHPRFAEYMAWRGAMSALLVEASSFSDWLSCQQRQECADHAASHPGYEAFRQWMVANQGGARKCPSGSFPANFRYWLDGGRW